MNPSDEPYEPPIPWALSELLRDGAAELAPRELDPAEPLDLVLVLPPGVLSVAAAGIPDELLDALERQGCEPTLLACDDALDAIDADVVLAAGWNAAPEVLTLTGLRARAVLATPDPAPLQSLGWTEGVPLLGPSWLGGTLPPAADEVYRPLPTHRREDVVHLHGQDPLTMLIAAELVERRPELTLTISGMSLPVELPFEAQAAASGPEGAAEAFASATVALAPPVRGWRPAAAAMLACGLPAIVPDCAEARAAFGEAAAYAGSPQNGADRAEALLDDLALRAEHARAGGELVLGWDLIAERIAGELRAL